MSVAEEALGHGVVPAITLAAHRAHDAVLIEHGLVGRSRVLSTTVVLPPSSVATPCLNASVSWPACVGERH